MNGETYAQIRQREHDKTTASVEFLRPFVGTNTYFHIPVRENLWLRVRVQEDQNVITLKPLAVVGTSEENLYTIGSLGSIDPEWQVLMILQGHMITAHHFGPERLVRDEKLDLLPERDLTPPTPSPEELRRIEIRLRIEEVKRKIDMICTEDDEYPQIIWEDVDPEYLLSEILRAAAGLT